MQDLLGPNLPFVKHSNNHWWLLSAEHQRILDDMLKRRLESRGETDTESDAIQQILALVSGLADDASLIVDNEGTKVDARTVRVWASFHRTPERTQ